MNRTLKDATVRRYHYSGHDELRAHLRLFLDAYNHARRLKAPRGLTAYEFICRAWTKEPERFKIHPSHHILGLNTYLYPVVPEAAAMRESRFCCMFVRRAIFRRSVSVRHRTASVQMSTTSRSSSRVTGLTRRRAR